MLQGVRALNTMNSVVKIRPGLICEPCTELHGQCIGITAKTFQTLVVQRLMPFK